MQRSATARRLQQRAVIADDIRQRTQALGRQRGDGHTLRVELTAQLRVRGVSAQVRERGEAMARCARSAHELTIKRLSSTQHASSPVLPRKGRILARKPRWVGRSDGRGVLGPNRRQSGNNDVR